MIALSIQNQIDTGQRGKDHQAPTYSSATKLLCKSLEQPEKIISKQKIVYEKKIAKKAAAPQVNNAHSQRYLSGASSNEKKGQLKLEIDSRKNSPVTKAKREKQHQQDVSQNIQMMAQH